MLRLLIPYTRLLNISLMFFFFNLPATTEIYTYLHTLSPHDALPISSLAQSGRPQYERLRRCCPKDPGVSKGVEMRLEAAVGATFKKWRERLANGARYAMKRSEFWRAKRSIFGSAREF